MTANYNSVTTTIVGNTGYPDGYSVGLAVTDKVGFYGTTPAIQPAATAQSAVATTAITTVVTTAATSTTPYGFSTSTQPDAIVAAVNSLISRVSANVTLLNELRSDLVTLGIIKGSA